MHRRQSKEAYAVPDGRSNAGGKHPKFRASGYPKILQIEAHNQRSVKILNKKNHRMPHMKIIKTRKQNLKDFRCQNYQVITIITNKVFLCPGHYSKYLIIPQCRSFLLTQAQPPPKKKQVLHQVLTHLIITQTYETGTVLISILWLRRLRHDEVNHLARGYILIS